MPVRTPGGRSPSPSIPGGHGRNSRERCPRQRRTAVLAPRPGPSQKRKAAAADQAIRRLVKKASRSPSSPSSARPGCPTPSSTETPILRDRIERLRDQGRPKPPPPDGTSSDNTIIQALTSQITHLKKQHRDENAALRAALEQAHGENLELRRELTRLGWNPQPATTK